MRWFELRPKYKSRKYLIDDLGLLSTSKKCKSILEVDDMKKISVSIEQNSSARKIPYNKLTKDDVKNMKSVYNQQTREAFQRASTEQANLLIQQMQSNGYMTFYDFGQTMFLKSVFFASKPMTERAK
ncbi:hypothetical protein A0J61_09664 [Choanephora cucurbitarum]|uniref:Uncharacterized protein n=1 Tax=Choanephora cucurbitarum TaxID=101091 RepID=A0A1C7MZG2_9FUNG|nr:hypothetical protein A0J61_09664 [Choanephora cucurbitarum]